MSEIAVEYRRDRECVNTHRPLTHSLDYGKEQAVNQHTCEASGCADATKTCTKCGDIKSLSEFHRNATKASGHVSHCKACVRSYTTAYNAANREQRRERDKAYYQANRDEKIRYQREYYAANREAQNAATRANYAANRDKYIAYSRARYQANRESAIEYRREYYVANREAALAWRRKYYQANRDEILEKRRIARLHRWANDPSYRAQFYAANIRRKRLLAGAAQEPYTREGIFERDGWMCRICDEPIDPDRPWPDRDSASIDHIIPLSRGGDDTPGNVQAAHLSCNVGKGDRVDTD